MEKKRSTDTTMKKVWLCLSRDFDTALGVNAFSRLRDVFLEKGIRGLREIDFPIWDNSDSYFLKCQLQLAGFHKRYRYENDVFSDDELLHKSKIKFLETQERISRPLDNSEMLFRVLQRARTLAKGILGEYTAEEHMALCRFGKRACAGHPYSRSYLDLKLSGPLSGSPEHIAWFERYLLTDSMLSAVVREKHKGALPYQICDSLALSFVPKSWKSYRSIKPNTLLGSFYTQGLGRLIQERLLHCGLDIRTLQEKHKVLARVNSHSRRLATADLSAASDSITSELLRKVLPLPWFRAVMLGRTSHFTMDNQSYPLMSVATMGDGHTFPLQTLVFYCLLKAIGDLLSRRTFVSVYGDDLIYPSWLHRYVRSIFPKMHLQLNMEKTYVSSWYRESCGGDYFRGIDVRPFNLEGDHQMLTPSFYSVFLYKVLNGLLRRWDRAEIPETVELLLTEIFLVGGEILQVPPSFPDGSGFKVDRPVTLDGYAPVSYTPRSGTVQFKYLHVFPDTRCVKTQYPYYWDTLRTMSTSNVPNPYDGSDIETLLWKRATQAPLYVKVVGGGRQKRLVACTPCKATVNIKRQRGSTSSWT